MTLWDVVLIATRQQATGVEEYRVRRMIAKGKLGPNDLLRKAGTEKWIAVADLDDSVWTDSMPDAQERERLRDDRQGTKRKPASPPPPPTSVPPPPPAPRRRPSEPDSHAETVPYIPTNREAADPHFKMGPVEDDAPTKPWVHVTPPPVRQSPKPAESETPAFRKRPPWEPESLDLTALVDVTLFLMFFFMVTSSYNMQKSLDLPKPAPDDQTAQQAPTLDDLRDDNIVLEVLADDSVLMNDRTVPVAELPDLLRAEMRQTGLNEVILRASPQAHHEAVVSAYDAANQVGAQRIRLAKLADEADADAASSP